MKRDYRDRRQAEPYWAAYGARYAELEAAGQYPYNDCFKGHLGAPAEDEDFLIYMCQKERHLRDTEAKIAECVAVGFVALESVPDGTLCLEVVEHGIYMGETGWRTYKVMRVRRDGGRTYLMPKGARTRGYLVEWSALARVAA